ncbi:MAG: MoxR family ATPase, partial [Clostridiales bacterium]|nr:MoxR family ATPase [Clostridiales bacterium]
IEQDGTYPLPEAQMDRFMFKLLVTYPNREELKSIVGMTQITMDEVADVACNAEELLAMRATAKEVPIADEVMDYAMSLTLATQPESEYPASISKKYVRCGASPRAAQALISAAKVRALINGRYNVSYNDLNELACPVLRHRIKLTFEAVTDNVSADDVIKGIITELKHGNTAMPEEGKDEGVESDKTTTEKRGRFGGKKK